jgi:hypothetical protein
MKRIIRLTESDLTRIVKRVIEENDSFTFGDKVRGKLGKFFGVPETGDYEKKLATEIMNKVESGDFEIENKTDGYVGKGFTIKIVLEDGEYKVQPRKERRGVATDIYDSYTIIETPNGEKKHINAKGYTNKLIDLINPSSKSRKFDKSDYQSPMKFKPKAGSSAGLF